MAKLEGKVLIAQGGGPTAVINQSLIGVALEARKFPQVTRIYGAINGVRGIINEEFIDLTHASHDHRRVEEGVDPGKALEVRVPDHPEADRRGQQPDREGEMERQQHGGDVDRQAHAVGGARGRGVGNLHGVRFNCPPEVSLITLA